MKKSPAFLALFAAGVLTACGTDMPGTAAVQPETTVSQPEAAAVQTETLPAETSAPPLTAAAETAPAVSDAAQPQALQPAAEGAPDGQQQSAVPAAQTDSPFTGKWEVDQIGEYDRYLGQYGTERYCVWYQSELLADGSAVFYDRSRHDTRYGTWQPEGNGIRLQLSGGDSTYQIPDDMALELKNGMLCGTNAYDTQVTFKQVSAFTQPEEPAYYEITGKWTGDHGEIAANGTEAEREWFGGGLITDFRLDVSAYHDFAVCWFHTEGSDYYEECGIESLGGNRYSLLSDPPSQYGSTFRLEGDTLIFEINDGFTKELVYRRQ